MTYKEMTYEEAKFVLEKNMSVFDIRLNSAYDKAIEALEKQIPKKFVLKKPIWAYQLGDVRSAEVLLFHIRMSHGAIGAVRK